jgi:peptide/nickel transport system ATP-binding protein
MGVIFITHNPGIVAELADRVMAMYKGANVKEGPAGKIAEIAEYHYTKALLACRPALHPKQVRLPVVSDFIREDMTVVADVPLNPTAAEITVKAPESTVGNTRMMHVKDLRVWFTGHKRSPAVKSVD